MQCKHNDDVVAVLKFPIYFQQLCNAIQFRLCNIFDVPSIIRFFFLFADIFSLLSLAQLSSYAMQTQSNTDMAAQKYQFFVVGNMKSSEIIVSLTGVLIIVDDNQGTQDKSKGLYPFQLQGVQCDDHLLFRRVPDIQYPCLPVTQPVGAIFDPTKHIEVSCQVFYVVFLKDKE